MWNAIQGAAGNFANRASRLAVEVLDAGPPEGLQSHGLQPSHRASAPGSVQTTDRLSALKARYKAPNTVESTSPPWGQRKVAVPRSWSRSDEVGMPSGLDDSAEVARLKDQLERLKKETLHQTMAADELMKQQQFEWSEQMREKEQQRRNALQQKQEDMMHHFQSKLDAKEEEIQCLREAVPVGVTDEGRGDLSVVLKEKQGEIDRLNAQIVELQQNDINAAFGIESERSQDTAELLDLRGRCDELAARCQMLESANAEMVTAQAMTEREAFWRRELQEMESAHREKLEALEDKQQPVESDSGEMDALKAELGHTRGLLQDATSEKEALLKEKLRSEEDGARLQQSLEERDSVWQQELISSQNEQQELRKQYEAAKRELTEAMEKCSAVSVSHAELEKELRNEADLRTAAQEHVRSLQKNMMEIDSGASSLRQELDDVRNQLQKTQQSCDHRLQESDSQRTELQEQHRYQAQAIQDLKRRLAETESERQDLQNELQKRLEGEADSPADIAKLTYDLESAAEKLKLAESRNSLLGHEVETLTQELEHMKLAPVSDGSAPADLVESLQKAESERDSCKEQLKRLKQQMIQMQEDQEASLHWRIEAEVKLALEEYKKQQPSSKAPPGEVTSLKEALEQSKGQIEQKDAELTNLQIALGELRYHGEAADKLRRDLRSAQDQMALLKNQIIDANAAVAEAGSARKAAEASADAAHRRSNEQTDKIHQLEGSLFSAKKELLDATQQLRKLGSEEGTVVDRRLVVQLLANYLQKRHSREALDTMTQALGFTVEEKQRVGSSLGGSGLLGSVAGGTLAFVKGSMSVATLGLLDRGLNSKAGSQLVDQWVDFLTKETDPVSQEDPLSYLQKGAPQYRSFVDETSEASASMQSVPRFDSEPLEKYPSRHHGQTSSVSSRGEATPTPVLNYTVPETKFPQGTFNPVSRTAVPSFKDFMEMQKDVQSD